MILIFDRDVAIMTPPKCACSTLHAALCAPPFGAHTAVGPSCPGLFDRHVTIWPSEARTMRRFVVVRDPYARLVSLYLHFARWQASIGMGSPHFGGFARQAVEGKLEPFYGWQLSQWLAHAGDAEVLRVESLVEDLHGLGIDAELPRVNVSFYRRPWQDFYTPELVELVSPWAAPDCERWGYAVSPSPPSNPLSQPAPACRLPVS